MSVLFVIGAALAAIGCGVAAGFFMTFSDLIMPSLEAVEGRAGIEAMQMINIKVNTSVSVSVLWAMVFALPILLVLDLLWAGGVGLPWILSGGALYLLGVLVVSFRVNVPMNNRLEAMDRQEESTQAYWATEFVPRWIRWNSVRTIAATGAAICYAIAAFVAV